MKYEKQIKWIAGIVLVVCFVGVYAEDLIKWIDLTVELAMRAFIWAVGGLIAIALVALIWRGLRKISSRRKDPPAGNSA